ncbi:hypothetical protein C8Q79DRAFT_907017 [Trametes meyenii]|nr:hypothetical protein C8Q79DRAFT_907017 [Trametes meyenii]
MKAHFSATEQGATITFLLRRASVFDSDEKIQSYIKQGKARLVVGDALVLEDVRKGWQAALEAGNGSIDFVIFTIGGYPNFHITKGLVLEPADICTRSLLNLFRTVPAALRAPEAQPRFIVVTSRGITHDSHKTLPLAMKAFYSFMLGSPHADKLGAERVLTHCMGRKWTDEEPRAELLPRDWTSLPDAPAEGEFKRIVIIRPSLLSDGACKADEAKPGKPGYKAVAGEIEGGYTVSRKDTAHFIVTGAVQNWDQWEGKGVCLVY